MDRFPTKTIHTTITIGPRSIPTQFIVNRYSNLLFILVTQTGKMGTLTIGQKETATALTNNTTTLLGDRSDYIGNIYTDHLQNLINNPNLPLLFGCSLLPCENNDEDVKNRYNHETLKDVVQVLQSMEVF
jgi:hypothetical protein